MENRIIKQEFHKQRGILLAVGLLVLSLVAVYIEYAGSPSNLPYTIALITAALTPLILNKKQMSHPVFMLIYLTAIGLIFTTPIFKNFEYWGFHDWDYHAFIREVSRTTILQYHQIPHWNPYNSGGNILLANWSSGFLSPSFIIVLWFGAIKGTKILIVTHTIIGLIGFFLLSHHMGLRGYISYLPGFIFMFSSFYSLHIAVGHFAWIATAWLPYAFLYYRMSYGQKKYAFLAGFFTAIMYLESHGYQVAYTILLIGLHSSLKTLMNLSQKEDLPVKKKLAPLIILFIFLSSTIMLGAVKMLPTYLFTQEYPTIRNRQPGFTISTLYESFVNVNRISTAVFWHNKSAYMGFLPLILALMGMVSLYRKEFALIIALIIIVWASFTTNAPLNMWEMIHSLPIFSTLRAPTRLITLVVFILAIFAGEGLKRVRSFNSWIPPLILSYIILILITTNSPALYKAFVVKPYEINRKGLEFQQIISRDKLKNQNSNCYAHFLANQGTINCFEPVTVPRKAMPKAARSYRGEAYMFPSGEADISYFSPNWIIVKAEEETGTVILNQNYHSGWYANGIPAVKFNGLIGYKLKPGENTVNFTYHTPGFIPGALITLFGFVLLVLALTNNLGKIIELIRDRTERFLKEKGLIKKDFIESLEEESIESFEESSSF